MKYSLSKEQLLYSDRFLEVTLIAFSLGSKQLRCLTFGAINLAHLPLPHPASNPIESLFRNVSCKIEK